MVNSFADCFFSFYELFDRIFKLINVDFYREVVGNRWQFVYKKNFWQGFYSDVEGKCFRCEVLPDTELFDTMKRNGWDVRFVSKGSLPLKFGVEFVVFYVGGYSYSDEFSICDGYIVYDFQSGKSSFVDIDNTMVISLDVTFEYLKKMSGISACMVISRADVAEDSSAFDFYSSSLIYSCGDGIWMSVDTCSDTMLKNMNKGYGTKIIINAIENCQKLGTRCNLVLLLGGPGESVETLNETFDFLEKYNPNIAVIMYGLRIYPNTPLYDIALKENIVSEGMNMVEPRFYVSSKIKDNIVDVISERCKAHNNWYFTPEKWDRAEKIKSKLIEKSVQKYYRLGIKGPFWAIVDKIQNNLI